MWTKIKKTNNGTGRVARTTFAVTRSRTGKRAAALIIPGGADISTDNTADIYSDGKGRLAFRFRSSGGEFRIYKASTSSKAMRLGIPQAYSALLPFGTHDVSFIKDGDMLILDTSQIAPASTSDIAAE